MPAVWCKTQTEKKKRKETLCDFSVATKTKSDLMQVINCPGGKSGQRTDEWINGRLDQHDSSDIVTIHPMSLDLHNIKAIMPSLLYFCPPSLSLKFSTEPSKPCIKPLVPRHLSSVLPLMRLKCEESLIMLAGRFWPSDLFFLSFFFSLLFFFLFPFLSLVAISKSKHEAFWCKRVLPD